MPSLQQLEARGTGAGEAARLVAALPIETGLAVLALVNVGAVALGLVEGVAGVADASEVALLVVALAVPADLGEKLALVNVPTFVLPARPGRVEQVEIECSSDILNAEQIALQICIPGGDMK